MNEQVYHIPALLAETMEALKPEPGGVYVDVTYGGGGHSSAISALIGEDGRLYAFDQDNEALERGQKHLDELAAEGKTVNITLIHGNFRYLGNFLDFYGVDSVDGILGDLGVSFHHFDDPERGFSFRWEEGLLDMRMNRDSSLTARDVLNDYSEQRLADIIYLYGQLRSSRRIAAAIVKARQAAPIETVKQLLDIIKPYIDPRQEKKELAQMFQALRIEVNGETEALKALLTQAAEALKPGGRLAIITYHSLEDKLVKNFMKTGNFEGEVKSDLFGRTDAPMKLLTSKPIVPTAEEIERNPRSRSAKLRVAVKL